MAPDGVLTRAYDTYGDSPGVNPVFDRAAFCAARAAAAEALMPPYPECAAARDEAYAELMDAGSRENACPYKDNPGCGNPEPYPFNPG